MKKDIHPQNNVVVTRCACGNSFTTHSTAKEIKTTLCSACHPFYTGTQKFVDTAGRIEKFEKKYNQVGQAKPAARDDSAPAASAPAAKKPAAKAKK